MAKYMRELGLQSKLSKKFKVTTNSNHNYLVDLNDRKIIGWSLSDGMSTEETTLLALKMAVKNRNIEKGLIFHSDKGVQYASKKFVNVLDSYKKITCSMSRKGNCWDNAVAESFF